MEPTAAAQLPPADGPSLTSPDELRELAGRALQDASSKWAALWEEGEKYVRANPGRSLLVALGAGVMLGLLLKD